MKRMAALCALIAIAGCMPIAVQHDYDPSIDFSLYQSFAWLPLSPEDSGTSANLSGPFFDRRIRKAVAEGLAARDVTFAPERPDLLVAYQVRYRRHSRVYVNRDAYHRYAHTVDTTHYREGTLILDLVDPVTGELIWRGWAVSDIHRTSSPAQEQKQIVEAVEEILKRFPPHQEKRE